MVLHFLDKQRGQRFIITRRLRGVATSPTKKQSRKKGGGAQRAGDALILLGLLNTWLTFCGKIASLLSPYRLL